MSESIPYIGTPRAEAPHRKAAELCLHDRLLLAAMEPGATHASLMIEAARAIAIKEKRADD